jgi:hypothetical protein
MIVIGFVGEGENHFWVVAKLVMMSWSRASIDSGTSSRTVELLWAPDRRTLVQVRARR